MAKRVISLRLDEVVLADLDKLVAAFGSTRSDTIERAIRLAILTSSGTAELQYDLGRQKRYG